MGIVSAVCDKQFLFPNDAFFFCEWKINFKYTKMHPHEMESSRIHTSWFKNYTNPHKLRPHIKLATEIQTVTLTLTNKPFFLQTCLFGISDAFSERGIHLMLLKLNIKKITRWKRWKKSELQNDRNFYWREKKRKMFWADIIKLFISEWCFYRDNEYWQLLNSLLFPIICVCMFLFFS